MTNSDENPKTLLIVDDEASILHSLDFLFKERGYEVYKAQNGQEALEILEQHKAEVILSDQQMPEMNGIEFFKVVKEQYPDTIRVILSGFIELSHILDAINKGEIYRYLTKPWEIEDLLSTVCQCYDYYYATKQNKSLLSQILEKNKILNELNLSLEKQVQERTKTMRLTMQIMEKLPLPIAGFDQDYNLIFTNKEFDENFTFKNFYGRPHELFPEWISKFIDENIANQKDDSTITGDWKNINIELQMKTIKDREQFKGFYLIFKKANP